MVAKKTPTQETTAKVPAALRYAVYLRDGFACVYCEGRADDGVPLTIDHVQPRTTGGPNVPENLVTCCEDCNSSKRDMSLRGWALYLRERGYNTAPMTRRVKKQLGKPVDLKAGQALAAQRREK